LGQGNANDMTKNNGNVHVIKNLNGHSGCSILLCHLNEAKIVRKISSRNSYNSRLQAQMEKQMVFRDECLKTPRILNSGHVDGLFFFDMEYVAGLQFSEFVEKRGIHETTRLFEKITNFLRNKKQENKSIYDEIEAKINDLEKLLDFRFKKFIKYCKDFDWHNLDKSYSHGDLTLENILVNGGDIYLIDFLDSPLNFKVMDYGKILQDLLLTWAWRNRSNYPLIRNLHLYNMLMNDLSSKERRESMGILMLNMLRIIPYADLTTQSFIESRLNHLHLICEKL
jgi:serine/threonine protein kinase